jgi:hypothetical protein
LVLSSRLPKFPNKSPAFEDRSPRLLFQRVAHASQAGRLRADVIGAFYEVEPEFG